MGIILPSKKSKIIIAMANLDREEIDKIIQFLVFDDKLMNLSDKDFYKYFNEKIKINLNSTKYDFMNNTAVNRLIYFVGKEIEHEVVKVLILMFVDIILNPKLEKLKSSKTYNYEFKEFLLIINKLSSNDKFIKNSIHQNMIQLNYLNINDHLLKEINDLLLEKKYIDAVVKSIHIVEQRLLNYKVINELQKINDYKNFEKLLKNKLTITSDFNYYAGVHSIFKSLYKFRNYIVHTECEKISDEIAMHYILISSLALHYIETEFIEPNNI